ncbi:MAG TPA: GxxExxY protein [Tepidisphaeraceae bacterium]|nr:GxxExxY protein [Tepidisphaeraceae bacterium]
MTEVDEIIGFEEPGDDLDRLDYATIGAALAVHSELGPGHPESAYEEALAFELELRGLPFSRQEPYNIVYKGRHVGRGRLDIVVGGVLIVEIKAVESLASVHAAQVVSYLKATHRRLGILLNFNVKQLKAGGVKRIANTR